MARTQCFLLITNSLFVTSLFIGCAAGPKSVDRLESAATAEKVTISEQQKRQVSDPAQQAFDAGNFQLAVKQYAEQMREQDAPADTRLFYGIALNRTGQHHEAIEQLKRHMQDADPRGSNSLLAQTEIAKAEQVLQHQREEAAHKATRTASKQAVLGKLGDSIDRNWQHLQQQLASRPATITEPLTGTELILVTGGCYQMGDLFGDGRTDEQPVHEVCVGDFYLGKYEVTQRQWQQVMGYNPSEFQQGDNYPVESVSWQEVVEFTATLSGSNGKFRLPTEAEWEYASRSGGKKQKFSGGANADQFAWHEDNSGDKPKPVGQKQPNGLGLYDMSGNLFEWCLDRYARDYYQTSPVQNPRGADRGNERVRRGGSWSNEPSFSRTSERRKGEETVLRHPRTGFRLALPVR